MSSICNLDAVRSQMYDNVMQFLQNPQQNTILHLNEFPQAGKTFAVSKALHDSYSSFIYLTDSHKAAEDQIQNPKNEAFFNCMHIESRERLCARKDELIELIKNGISLKPICKSCRNRFRCEYNNRIADIYHNSQSWVGVHAHLGGLVNDYVTKFSTDVVVIDEDCLTALKRTLCFSAKTCKTTIMLLEQYETYFSACIFAYRFVLQCLKLCLESIFSDSVLYIPLFRQIQRYFNRYSKEELLQFSETYEDLLIARFYNREPLFFNIITTFISALQNIFQFMKTIKDLSYFQAIFQITYHITEKGYQMTLLDIAYYDLEALNIPAKIMLLDATTPTDLYQSLITSRSIHASTKIDYTPYLFQYSTVYQLTTAKYCMETLDQPESLRKLLHLTKTIAELTPNQILCVARKKYIPAIKKMGENIICDNFPLRGVNCYESIDTCIIFGTPDISADDFQRIKTLLHISTPLLDQQLHYLFREAMILQAAHRIRAYLKGIQGKPTTFYFLTSLPLNIPTANLLSLGALQQRLDIIHPATALDCLEEAKISIRSYLQTHGSATPSALLRHCKFKPALPKALRVLLDSAEIVEQIIKPEIGRPSRVFILNPNLNRCEKI